MRHLKWCAYMAAMAAFALSVGLAGAQQQTPTTQKAWTIPISPGEQPSVLIPTPPQPAKAPEVRRKKASARPVVPALKRKPAGRKSGPGPQGQQPAPPTRTDVKMSLDGTFELHVQNADIRTVFMHIGMQNKKNVIVSKDVEGTVTIDLYGVTFKQVLDALVRSNGLMYQEREKFIYVFTLPEWEELRKQEDKVQARVFRLAYLRANDAMGLISVALSPKGKVTLTPPAKGGIETDATITGGKDHAAQEVIVVYDYQQNLENVAQILQELDVRPQQVLIEATILAATLTDNNALGIDLHMLGSASFRAFAATTDLTNIAIPPAAVANLNHHQGRLSTPFSQNFPAESTPMTIGFVSDDIAIFVRALEEVTDTNVLANPKLLVVNKQRGEVLIGRRDGYLTTIVTQSAAIQTVEFLETGTRLIVRPFVGKDGYIRMEIHPEVSEGEVEQIGDSTLALPRSRTTEVTSNVMVRDGKTIVIGGLFRERMITQRTQVPILGNIPVVGAAFRSTVDDTIREEVIILITPHIISHGPDEAASEQLKMDMERFRIGMRDGLHWWSRNRLAESFMQWARRDVRTGEIDRAMWNLDCALSLDHKMSSAIRLKEQLTEQAFWANRPQYVFTKNVIARMIMQDIGRPVQEVVPPGRPLDVDKIAPEVRKAFGIEKAPQKPLPLPAPKPAPKVESEPAPEPEPKVESEPEVEPKPEPEVEPEPAPESEPKVEPEPEVEPKPAPKVEPEPSPAGAVDTQKENKKEKAGNENRPIKTIPAKPAKQPAGKKKAEAPGEKKITPLPKADPKSRVKSAATAAPTRQKKNPPKRDEKQATTQPAKKSDGKQLRSILPLSALLKKEKTNR